MDRGRGVTDVGKPGYESIRLERLRPLTSGEPGLVMPLLSSPAAPAELREQADRATV
jgi:hypothetical protein